MSSWLFPAACLAAVVTLASCDAGHFFAQTPKHLPRIGRRSELPPLVSFAETPKHLPRIGRRSDLLQPESFIETPKHLPRIGRRSELQSLLTTESRSESPSSTDHSWAELASALASADTDGDGCLNVREVIHIPAVRAAILQRDPTLLAPLDYDYQEEDQNEDSSRPQPRLLRFRK